MANSDAFFSMGKTHEVCQDYARAGDIDGRQFAIVSDGCSSSPDTDFGARALVMSAIQCRREIHWKPLVAEWTIWHAKNIIQGYGLSPFCLDATLLTILPAPSEGYFSIHVCGDGVIIIGNQDGSVDMWDFDCNGAPSYLSYFLDENRLASYRAEGYGIWEVTHYRRESGSSDWKVIPKGDIDPSDPPLKFDLETPGIHWNVEPKKDGVSFIMAVSDGIHSFQRVNDLQSISIQEVANHLVDFKSFTGQFITRRCRAFEKFCIKEGWQHSDDLGVAAVYTGGNDELD